MYISTHSENPAQRLYRRVGFELEKEHPNLTYEDELIQFYIPLPLITTQPNPFWSLYNYGLNLIYIFKIGIAGI